jgi:hypothetical protein
LDVIEYNQYDVFNRRAFVTLAGKLKCLAEVWTRRQFRPRPIPLSQTELQARREFAPIILAYNSEETEVL